MENQGCKTYIKAKQSMRNSNSNPDFGKYNEIYRLNFFCLKYINIKKGNSTQK